MEWVAATTITELSTIDSRVYVYLSSEAYARAFLQQAEAEGFKFRDGADPTEREAASVMAVNSDRTLNYVGINGMAAFGSGTLFVGGRKLLRVAYRGQSSMRRTAKFLRFDSASEIQAYEAYYNAIVHYLMASSWHYSEKAAEDLMQMREDYVVEAFLSKEPIEDAAVEVGYCCG